MYEYIHEGAIQLCLSQDNWRYSAARGKGGKCVRFKVRGGAGCSVAQWCLTLWSHGLQHARFLCPSLSPRVCSSSCPLNQWCYPTIPSSATLFSFCLQSFPAIRVFSNESAVHIRWASIGASTSASVITAFMNHPKWSGNSGEFW